MPETCKRNSKDSFLNSPIHCIKHNNYFAIYDELLTKFINLEITFVEVGILDGGSLLMWRDFFGPKARIIGIDLNPDAKKWESFGIEIFIGDQSDPNFWNAFYSQVGQIDILLDDGGHKNEQQVVTTLASIPFIKDGGLVIVEDTCTSYMKFDNFKNLSFISQMKREIDAIHSRSPALGYLGSFFSARVHAIKFFENICAIYVDESKCLINERITNGGARHMSKDFRYEADSSTAIKLRKIYDGISLDYLPAEKMLKYPRLANFLGNNGTRKVLRLAIVPLRFIIYFLMKLENFFKFKKILKYYSALLQV